MPAEKLPTDPCMYCKHTRSQHLDAVNAVCTVDECDCGLFRNWIDEDIAKEPDMVNHPPHYTKGKIEVWDFIRDQGLNYQRGNVVKYVVRAGVKDKATEVQDLEKAIAYLKQELIWVKSGS